MASSLIPVVTVLESYRGRDKIIRTVSFAACLGSGLVKNEELAQKLLKVMSELSACRTILRLFDDLSMMAMTLGYGLGKQDKDLVQRTFSLMSNVINQLFFPIEHIAWAAEKGLISIPSAPWWFASLLTWITSLVINIVSGMWRIIKLHRKIAAMGSRRSGPVSLGSESLSDLQRLRKKECFSIVENASNLGMAVHWLPGGRLWSGKLNNVTVGALGIISSGIGLIKMTAFK